MIIATPPVHISIDPSKRVVLTNKPPTITTKCGKITKVKYHQIPTPPYNGNVSPIPKGGVKAKRSDRPPPYRAI